jgi:L-asparaginase
MAGVTRRVVVLATGGTIASALDASGAVVPVLGARDLVNLLTPVPGIEVLAEDFERFASWNAGPPIMLRLARRADELRAEADGVVVTHGTDTIEETAYLLDLVLDGPGPVAVTGAMRNNSEPGRDGPRNLWNAIRVAAAPDAAARGCLVVMNDEIHRAAEVTKAHSFNAAGFVSPFTGPVGFTDSAGVVFTSPPERARRYATTTADASVQLVKMAAGLDATLLRAAIGAGADGIVLEGSGLGHVPRDWVPVVRDAVRHDVPVVLTSRTLGGRVLPVYGGPGGGLDLRDAGVINGGTRSGPKARIELVCALGAGLRGTALRAAFERPRQT